MKKFSTIATHDSQFHADDLFAVAVLLEVAEKRGETALAVLRLRKREDLDKADLVVDVGGIYDPETLRFDHHQTGYNERRPNGASYASFGLVWKHFGKELCSEEVHERVDIKLVQGIDAHDTGEVLVCEYSNGVRPLFLRDALYRHRPLWNEHSSNEDFDRAFNIALVEARSILKRYIQQEEAQVAANEIVRKAYDDASDKRIVELSQLIPFEEEICKYPEPLFVVMKDVIDRWQVRGVPAELNKFAVRQQFPESWAGAREPELEKITGVKGALNCHLKRFVVTTKTKEAAYEILNLVLKN